ncbi:uncharacterized protein LOC143894416 [Temnothorax americanus]|uniref:uncharacterized protein LOC143894416 n=1 Tax=Temnothorax americanus TaxID=1964332 RepID=UPI0040677E89
MPARRSIIGRSLAIGYLHLLVLVGCVVSLSTSLAQVEDKKCVCTSKACKEAGVDTCITRFFCYTELIVTTGREIGESTTTRGCTEYVYQNNGCHAIVVRNKVLGHEVAVGQRRGTVVGESQDSRALAQIEMLQQPRLLQR